MSSSSAITGPVLSDVRRAPAGTAAAPSFAFNDSTGTGVYLVSAGVLGLSTAGVQRVVVDANGNVGIGTGTPENQVDVSSSTDPTQSFYRTVNTADVGVGRITWDAQNSSGTRASYARIQGRTTTNTAGSHTGALQFFTATAGGLTEKMRIDASGNVGIGTSTPQARLDLGNASGERLRLYSSARIGFGVDMGGIFGNSAFSNSGFNWGIWDGTTWTERMRIDASGRLLVGYTSTGPWPTGSIGTVGFIGKAGSTGVLNTAGNVFNINWTGSAAQLWIDTVNNGTISLTSDYRVKKNIETQSQPALERIAKLRPVKYEFADYKELFRADGVQREGFIAHELQEVIPSAVEGEKDAENQIQSLKLDALCSVLVKAIQEQQEIIGKLEARLAALEGK
jgi:hypothetical protein